MAIPDSISDSKSKNECSFALRFSLKTIPRFDDEPTEMFRVFNLNKLLYEVRKHADLNNPRLVFPTMLMVERKLLSNVFDFSPNMACEVATFSLSQIVPITG